MSYTYDKSALSEADFDRLFEDSRDNINYEAYGYANIDDLKEYYKNYICNDASDCLYVRRHNGMVVAAYDFREEEYEGERWVTVSSTLNSRDQNGSTDHFYTDLEPFQEFIKEQFPGTQGIAGHFVKDSPVYTALSSMVELEIKDNEHLPTSMVMYLWRF